MSLLISFLKIALGVAILVPLLACVFQEMLLFFPRAVDPAFRPGRNTEPVSVPTNGLTLRGWLVKGGAQPAPAAQPLPLVIYFGGNAEEVSWLADTADRFAGWSLLLVNYRGYGASDGKPGEKELFADALAIYDYAVRRADVDTARIVVMGRSLGSGVAVYLAANRPVQGVILASPYDSMTEVAQRHYFYLPVKLLIRHPFDSMSRVSGIRSPLACIVAADDNIIPLAHSRRLFEAWPGPKTWHEIASADHNTVSDEPAYWQAIAAFLRGLAAPKST